MSLGISTSALRRWANAEKSGGQHNEHAKLLRLRKENTKLGSVDKIFSEAI